MRLPLLSMLVLCLVGSEVLAQTPKYSNEFLNLGVGARGLGMGNSVVAGTDDVYSGYWNPAGMVRMEDDFQISYMHSEYFAGIAKYDYAGFAMQIDSLSSAGLSFIRFGVDDIPNTTQLIDATATLTTTDTSFTIADYAFLLTYSRRLAGVKGFTYGANVKVVYRQVGILRTLGDSVWMWVLSMLEELAVCFNGPRSHSTFNAWVTLDEETKEVGSRPEMVRIGRLIHLQNVDRSWIQFQPW